MVSPRIRPLVVALFIACFAVACSDDASEQSNQNQHQHQDVGADVVDDVATEDVGDDESDDIGSIDAGDADDDTGDDVDEEEDAGPVTDTDADTDADQGEEVVYDLPLDDFVADDSGFSYDVVWSEESGGITTSVLDVTSQHWRSEDEVNLTEWSHDVYLAVPNNADTNTVLVTIVGGSHTSPVPEPGDEAIELIETVATFAQTPVVGVSQIPFQPLTIFGEGDDMREDDLVASSWHKVLETGDPTWSAYFPMTRGVVRAMDAVQDFMEEQGEAVDDFVVTGYSKRGATTYLVAAVDERVSAMAPGVFDFLNFRPQSHHHLDVYGEPAPAVSDYAEYDLLNRVHDPEADILVETSDPYVYRERYTMPKLILASPGDQFFLPDSMQFYIDDIPGETLVRYLPNTGHSLSPPDGDAMDSITALMSWYHAIINDQPRPELDWTHDDGTITVSASPEPNQVKLWTATNTEARNFRIDVVGPIFESTDLEADAEGDFSATVDPPNEGFTAYLIEATFGSQVYSTQVYVTPDE